ncbi:hypothetical protein [Myxococcus virescens]|uniref:Uncharacterized protein n=1 Tax=Myxococcus virescens TaxID=83456 RepID=A0A511HPJ0_9BACT|nr:hypothetical protein [Myxococcus virescens]GEL75512.1 hypothetical protein MVI01_72960 [Myxococcus virescens]SDD65801.1 hypothetical protein SAMN04488504_102157 [Myxococcus virescens]
MAEKKAWVVDVGDEHQEVVFATCEGRARVLAGREAGADPREVTLRHEPRLDEYAPGPVPAEALLGLGWWLTCGWCEHHVTADGCDTCADDAEGEGGSAPEPVTEGASAWCSAGHRDADKEDRAERRQRESTARAAALARLPDAEVEWASATSDGGASVHLRVPGCRGPVTYEWPAGTCLVQLCDVHVLVALSARTALADWESEGGAQ